MAPFLPERQLALALERAVREHGTARSYTPGQLRMIYGGPPQAIAGKIGRDRKRLAIVAEFLRGFTGRTIELGYRPRREGGGRGRGLAQFLLEECQA